jgi:hypothetical protein
MMRVAWLLLLGPAALALGDAPALTQVQEHGPASLWLERDRTDLYSVKLSQTLTIVLRVEGAAPLEVLFTEKVRSTDGWHLEAVGKPKIEEVPAGKKVRWQQVFKATPLQPGQYPLKLPALQFTENDGPEQTVTWQPLPLRITTRVGKVDISEARDLTGIEELPPVEETMPPWWPWLFALVPLVAVAAFVLLRRKARPMAEPSPRDVALRQVEELAHLPASTSHDVERLHTRLSDVLRRYLEQQYDLAATRQTTAEFFAALAQTTLLAAPLQQSLSAILERCDLAKFAGMVPPAEECQRVVGMARAFVEQAV